MNPADQVRRPTKCRQRFLQSGREKSEMPTLNVLRFDSSCRVAFCAQPVRYAQRNPARSGVPGNQPIITLHRQAAQPTGCKSGNKSDNKLARATSVVRDINRVSIRLKNDHCDCDREQQNTRCNQDDRTTKTLLNAMAPAASMGFKYPNAAAGMRITL